MIESTSSPKPGQVVWGVREVVGRTAIIEFAFHDAYAAIEFAEICAAGLAAGEITIKMTYT